MNYLSLKFEASFLLPFCYEIFRFPIHWGNFQLYRVGTFQSRRLRRLLRSKLH